MKQQYDNLTKELLVNGFIHLPSQTETQLNDLLKLLGQTITKQNKCINLV